MKRYVSHADLGGKPGYGPVVPEPEGPPFHAAWEGRVMAINVALGTTGAWNIDMTRAARETLPDYARLDYWRIWLGGIERLLVARGLADADEVAFGTMRRAGAPVARVLHAEDVAAAMARGAPTLRPAGAPARFAIGARVRVRSDRPNHHTRLPGYARGRFGTIERNHGVHVFADANSLGLGEQPHWLYCVVLDPVGPAKGRNDVKVSFDAWEPYLEPA
ncbi:MAG: nitrile hydratase subunit beta [Caldimonas sp.]